MGEGEWESRRERGAGQGSAVAVDPPWVAVRWVVQAGKGGQALQPSRHALPCPRAVTAATSGGY